MKFPSQLIIPCSRFSLSSLFLAKVWKLKVQRKSMRCVVYWKSAVQSPIKRTTTTCQSVRQTHSSMCLCTPTQGICIHVVSAQTQLELNIFWRFLWKHHNSTSNSLVQNALYSWGTKTHADTHFCKISHMLRLIEWWGEQNWAAENQRHMMQAPVRLFHSPAQGGKADPFPRRKTHRGRKSASCSYG